MYTAGDTLIASSQVQLNSVYSSYIELPLVDFTGSTGENRSEEMVNIYPNPSAGLINLSFPGYEGMIGIYNLQGLCVRNTFKDRGSDDVQIDTRDLHPGVYVVRCGSFSGKFTHTNY
jgi:hypothetical protein